MTAVLGDPPPEVRAGLIGAPVEHSRSPAIHNAAYRALGLGWRYRAFSIGEGELAAALAEARTAGFRGLSVTTPLKWAVVPFCDRRSAEVLRVGAANTVVFDTATFADNTDGAGLIDDLVSAWGFGPAGERCTVIGAGAAARAAVAALSDEGAAVTVVARDPARAEAAAVVAEGRALVGEWSSIGEAALVVQAAALPRDGSADEEIWRLTSFIRASQLVVDLVYGEGTTPFAAAAAERGAAVRNGTGLLVHQAARQVALFTGMAAPLEEMWAAVGGREAARVSAS